jgi:hypothetical protein
MVTRERRVHPVIRTVNNDRWITAPVPKHPAGRQPRLMDRAA